ncbi:MAG TPA: hypothetical protein TECP_01354 [Hyphomicrobiaceae bacterium MAG_BT-2024]
MSQPGTIDRDVVSLIKVEGGWLASGSSKSDKLLLSNKSDSTHCSVVVIGFEKTVTATMKYK